MTTYICTIDGGEGGETTVSARDLGEAAGLAAAWARAGEWREDGHVAVRVEGPDGVDKFPVRVTKSPLFS